MQSINSKAIYNSFQVVSAMDDTNTEGIKKSRRPKNELQKKCNKNEPQPAWKEKEEEKYIVSIYLFIHFFIIYFTMQSHIQLRGSFSA